MTDVSFDVFFIYCVCYEMLKSKDINYLGFSILFFGGLGGWF